MKCWEFPVNEQLFAMHFKMILNLEFTYEGSQLEYHLNKKKTVNDGYGTRNARMLKLFNISFPFCFELICNMKF